MADSRFFEVEGPFNLQQLAKISGSEIGGNEKGEALFFDIVSLRSATKNDVTFIDNPRYNGDFFTTEAGVILLAPDMVDKAPSNAALLISKNPYLGYAKLTQAFYPAFFNEMDSIHIGACIDSSVTLGKNVVVETGAVIKEKVRIGKGSLIGVNTYIGKGVSIGSNCHIGSNVTLTHCIIGDNNIIHPGVRIGQDGFGFSPGRPEHTKINQLGRVIMGDKIEVGANTTIDRGSGDDTKIGDGTKIDNLVHIAHNVQIGMGCFITAQNGFAGSAKVGDFVSFGGQAAVTGHVTVGDGVQVSGQSAVTKDIAAGKTVAGNPAQDARQHWKGLATIKKIVKEKRG
ncbi:UDP-3-O-(3-hydroxymyristoyl)glucosamine N-acyltransferase [Gammaproteobacteria bacterium]|nr:UDP-3-O-(3-hydroxymyristoyl)glucosamine N-acyltransferase [Gammaproteobacteria bacterium]